MRGWKSLDYQALSDALRRSKPASDSSSLDALSVSDLFDLYSTTMSELVDNLLLLRRVKTRLRPLAAWFDGECRQHRRRTRCIERRYHRSKDPTDRLA